jgi:ParB-like chromosome segregation protein Spo0J
MRRHEVTTMPHPAPDGAYLLELRDDLMRAPVEIVPLGALRVTGSPRRTVEDPAHARRLADTGAGFPPLLVHRPSMTVIDGIHRLRAARMRGRPTIAVRFFDGSAEDGRLLAVALNVTHGLPLTSEERTAAAERILASRPHWSDRCVAEIAGVSSGKTAEIRRRLLGAPAPDAKRVGRDGRARAVDPSRGRERAAALLRQHPGASLRHIARQAGVSPTTVAAVRDRIARGEDVTVASRPARGAGSGSGSTGVAHADLRPAPPPDEAQRPADVGEIHRLLRRDPSLRLTEAGRTVLRLLDAGAAVTRDKDAIAASLPPHCVSAVARLAEEYAKSWQLFATEIQSTGSAGMV